MMNAARNAHVTLIALLLGACVTPGDIQQTNPIRRITFTGSHKDVAQCVQRRVGGKVHDDSFGERHVIYDAAKRRSHEGLTHYAVTVGRQGADGGFAEFRVMTPPRHGTSTGSVAPPRITHETVDEYWTPVQECAARPKGP